MPYRIFNNLALVAYVMGAVLYHAMQISVENAHVNKQKQENYQCQSRSIFPYDACLILEGGIL